MTAGITGAQPGGVTIARETPRQPDVIDLLHQSDRLAAALYPAASTHLLDLTALDRPEVVLLVARSTGPVPGAALGCVALVTHSDGTAEIKRMFLTPDARGQGLGRRLLAAIEAEARARGVSVLRLETGTRQPAAIALYRAAGYVERGPFGVYAADPLSLFMERYLGAAQT